MSRTLLYLPFVGLGLFLAAYSGFWFYARGATVDAVDQWIAREAAAGRRWTCPDRTVRGFPFRIELSCAAPTVTVERNGMIVADGRLAGFVALARAYAPRHVIAEATGPLVLTDRGAATGGPARTLTAAWSRARASVQSRPAGLDALSIETDGLEVSDTLAGALLRADHMEGHLRPSPGRAAEGAVDAALSARALVAPALDALLRNADPGTLDLRLAATRAEGLAFRGGVDEIEAWRQAGGRVEITTARLVKGPASLDITGRLGLDAERRPEGKLDVAAVGFDALLRGFGLGGGGGFAAIAGSLLGGRNDAPANGAARRPSTVRVPLNFEGGRVLLGPLPVARLAPLY